MGLYIRIRQLVILFLLYSFLVACSESGDEERNADTSDTSHEADLEAACSSLPSLPFCNSEPRPGAAKFTVGNADAVRWSGEARCHQIDFRTGRYGEDRLIKVEGDIKSLCKEDEVYFEFVYRKHTNEVSEEQWTSAFRPLSTAAANRLLDSCTLNSRPKPSAVMGSWWKANNTYAENLMLDYISPGVYATKLLPFDDDGIERLGEEVIGGVSTIQFRNEKATVWMAANRDDHRPVRVMDNKGKTDAYFTEWDIPFTAKIPAMRSLNEVCETH